MSKEIQKYGDIQQVDKNLWTLDGEWFETKFKRRMTLIKLRSGGLFVHNPFLLRDGDYEKLTALGPVEYIIAPNAFHSSDAAAFKNRFPKAHLYISKAVLGKVKSHCTIDGILPWAFGDSLRTEVECMEIEGTRILQESVFLHIATRTLIVTDLVFNLQCEVSGFEKAFFNWNKVYKRFGPSRIFSLVFLNSRQQARRSLSKLIQWDFDRVIMNHGVVLEHGGKAALIRGFKDIGLDIE